MGTPGDTPPGSGILLRVPQKEASGLQIVIGPQGKNNNNDFTTIIKRPQSSSACVPGLFSAWAVAPWSQTPCEVSLIVPTVHSQGFTRCDRLGESAAGSHLQ